MRKQLSEMRRNNPDAFGQFLFAVTVMILNLVQIVAVLFAFFH